MHDEEVVGEHEGAEARVDVRSAGRFLDIRSLQGKQGR